MRRYVDKTVCFAAGGLLALLVVCQVWFMLSARNRHLENMARAKDLADAVAASGAPVLPSDTAEYSGKVFRAWTELRVAQPLTAWDFYPDQR